MSSETGKPRRGRPRTFDAGHVADVAMRAYWEEGPTEVSLNEVCARAGVSKPSAYRAFGNDDGLTRAALARYAEEVLARAQAILVSGGPLREKVRRLAHLAAEDALHADGCLFVKMRAARARMGPGTQDMIDRIDATMRDAFTRVLEDGRATGEWSSDLPVDLGARYLHAQLGMALDLRARGHDPGAILDLALTVLFKDGRPAPPAGG